MMLNLFSLVISASAQVSEDKLPAADWISVSTASPGGFFRRTFVVEAQVIRAVLLGACAARMTVYLNGSEVGKIDGFEQAASIDATKALRLGGNVIAVRAANGHGAAAFRLMLELATSTGRQHWVVSDESWLASETEAHRWTEPDFAATGWRPAFSHGQAGLTKWGDSFHATKSVDAYNSWMLAQRGEHATDPSTLTVAAGFKVDLLRSAHPEEGSWIALAFDPKGRLTIARESRGLLRMTLDRDVIRSVEVIEDTLLECRGLLYAYDSLYVNANNSKGFYRLRDTNGDDQFDEKKLLLETGGDVGHGRNHVVLGPDGMIYLAHGNDVLLAPQVAADSPLKHFADDQLRLGNQKGHGPGVQSPPAGHVLQTDRDGSIFRVIAGGLRNMLDLAFNREGEMFTYDSDNERFIGAPWYAPTRVLHVVPGSDFGWRRRTDVWPHYFPDTLPAVIDIGVSSPTGIGFGYHSHFPPNYREALFIADWAYGRILAIHLTPKGASYAGTSELFLSGRPLTVADFTFGPDGAMYFVTGGRKTRSGLYRVSYIGTSTTPTIQKALPGVEQEAAELRTLRRKLETGLAQSPTRDPKSEIDLLWPCIGHADRWIRHAARIALERQPLELWEKRALREKAIDLSFTALLALARIAPKERQPELLARFEQFDIKDLSESQQLIALRIYGISFARMGRPDDSGATAVRRKLEAMYPSRFRFVNHELCRLLVYLASPVVIAKTTPLLARAATSDDLLHYLFHLRFMRNGWTLDQRHIFFEALARAEQQQGTRDYVQELKNIRKEVTGALSPHEFEALGALLTARSAVPAVSVDASALRFVKEWTLEDFGALERSRRPSPHAGRNAFYATQCLQCHRFRDEPGGVTGPDLTSVASRLGPRDLLDAILNPSKVIDEKFRNLTVTLKDGRSITGALEHEDADELLLNAGETVAVSKRDIAERKFSDLSPMPAGLLNILTEEQVLDLLAFFGSGAQAPAK
ncbi:MAG: DUF7133 domain-containing protein [Verrucomicrobiales bacterium]